MTKSEERRKVVTASYSFFKSAEQVMAVVSRLVGQAGSKSIDRLIYRQMAIFYFAFVPVLKQVCKKSFKNELYFSFHYENRF